MNKDLECLIALQHLDSAAHDAQRKLAEGPAHEAALAARVESARQRVTASKERLAENQTARRAIEKDVAMHQGRLSKFREQAMAVKTNQEYHAIQHEVTFAQTEIKKLEDGILELMVAADELAAATKKAEADLAAEQKSVDADRKQTAAEAAGLTASLDRIAAERKGVIAKITPQVLATFELVAQRRNGVAVAEARDGMCTVCRIRMRPQVFNTALKNEEILQCDHCQRILFVTPAAQAAAPAAPDNVQA
jgi:hypothetical protein